MSPFERIPAYSVYLPHHTEAKVTAETDLELAVCSAPGFGELPVRLISPQEVGVEHRGKGRNQRLVHNILPDSQLADSLLVVEVYTNEGDTSSWPAHKHDTAVEGQETYPEETYYHRFNPPQGFCLQRVYTDDRSLDECMAVYNRDVVKVPKGYHPVATIAGYDNYYLNVMAARYENGVSPGKRTTRGLTHQTTRDNTSLSGTLPAVLCGWLFYSTQRHTRS